jgi:hypothetical protein
VLSNSAEHSPKQSKIKNQQQFQTSCTQKCKARWDQFSGIASTAFVCSFQFFCASEPIDNLSSSELFAAFEKFFSNGSILLSALDC